MLHKMVLFSILVHLNSLVFVTKNLLGKPRFGCFWRTSAWVISRKSTLESKNCAQIFNTFPTKSKLNYLRAHTSGQKPYSQTKHTVGDKPHNIRKDQKLTLSGLAGTSAVISTGTWAGVGVPRSPMFTLLPRPRPRGFLGLIPNVAITFWPVNKPQNRCLDAINSWNRLSSFILEHIWKWFHSLTFAGFLILKKQIENATPIRANVNAKLAFLYQN